MRRFLLLILLYSGMTVAQPILIGEDEAKVNIKPFSQYFLDQDKSHTIDSILGLSDHEFQVFTDQSEVMDFGFTRDRVWLKLELVNQNSYPRKVFIDFDFAEINSIVLYHTVGNELLATEKAGSFHPNYNRPLRSRTLTMPVSLQPQTSAHLYFQIDSYSVLSLPATLYTETEFSHHKFYLDLIVYLLLGISSGFFLYHLVIYLGNKELVYLAFCATTVFRFSYDLYFTGVGQLLTPFNAVWNSFAPAYTGGLASIGGLWFHIEFLNLREKSPRFSKFLFFYMAVFFVGINYGFLVNPIAYFVLIPLLIVLPLILIGSTIPWVIKGYRPAIIYLAGSFLTAISVMWSNLSLMGYLPVTFNLAIYSCLGYSVSFVIFAYSISEKIEELRKSEKEAHLEAESAKALAQTKSQFLANMSHEIRTPLNGVLGMIQLLKASDLKCEQQKWVNIIDASGGALLTVVNDILDFSKIEAGKLSVNKIPCDLRNIINECYETFKYTHTDKRIVFTSSIDESMPEKVVTDPSRIQQIIINLLGNAFKFTDHGEICIQVKKLSSENQYRLAVRDTGIGIAAESQAKLFESFEQTSSDTYRRYGGTGLGLAISKELCELLGGVIGVESELGRGSSFWVDLPLPDACENTDQANGDSNQSGGGGVSSKLHILVAEDNQVNRMVVKAFLGKLGHSCDIVENGQEAVNMITKNHSKFQLVLMDCDMPIKNGFEATQLIRQYEQEHQIITPVPIVALTAHVTQIFRDQSIASGMDEHLTKPLDVAALHRILNQIAEQRSAEFK